MPETIITKICTKCKNTFPLSEFYKTRRRGRVEFFGQCKSCYKAVVDRYRNTEHGKTIHRKAIEKYQQSPKGKKVKKEAARRYARSEKGKATLRAYYRKYYDSEKGKEAYKRYRRTLGRKLASQRYYKSKKGQACLQRAVVDGRKRNSEQKYRVKYNSRIQARHAVNHAIEQGIFKPAKCFLCICGAKAQEYHHPSYDREDWLDVIPVCFNCHGFYHRDNYSRVVLIVDMTGSDGPLMLISLPYSRSALIAWFGSLSS